MASIRGDDTTKVLVMAQAFRLIWRKALTISATCPLRHHERFPHLIFAIFAPNLHTIV